VDEFACEVMDQFFAKRNLPERFNEFLLQSDELRYNLRQQSHSCAFMGEMAFLFAERVVTVIPIIVSARRLGTLLLARFNEFFVEEDLILAEKGAAVAGKEILSGKTEIYEKEARSRAIVKLAVGSLSYSEAEAVERLFKELSGVEGLLVASKIADELGMTRSVIVNALRKLESAGVLVSHSLGMKGTYIRVLNPFVFQYLDSR
jgi:transcriptional pleiotropic repressor